MNSYKTPFLHFLICCAALFSNNVVAVEVQKVMGAGPSTPVVTLFFEHFQKTLAVKDYKFEVEPRSIKHAGGIRASDNFLFGRTGRPLNLEEKALNKRDIFLARIPLSIVVGKYVGVKAISLKQLEKIVTGKTTNWKQLGGADHKIVLAGREATEAAFGVLKKAYPFFRKAKFEKIFTRDHQVVNFIKSKKGNYAISFGARSNFDTDYQLKVKGFEVGVSLGLVYDVANSEHPLVTSVKQFSKSKTWTDVISQSDFLPPENH